jgi:hypothetical protein
MELNENALQVLKNFATINPNIVVESGNVIRTLSEGKNVFGKAVLDINFPQKFGVYDLNEFLNVIGLVDKPAMSFEDTHVLIKDQSGLSEVKYFFTDSEYLTTSTKDIKMPDTEINFVIPNETLNKIKRAAGALGHSTLSIRANNGSISLTVFDEANPTSNTFSIDVEGTYNIEEFDVVLSIANMKLLPGDYKVEISSKLISHFINTTSDAEYWIALEKSSKYGV